MTYVVLYAIAVTTLTAIMCGHHNESLPFARTLRRRN